jgi:DNA-directed RNA polymerase subunit RPC12/RpoP
MSRQMNPGEIADFLLPIDADAVKVEWECCTCGNHWMRWVPLPASGTVNIACPNCDGPIPGTEGVQRA